MIQLELYVDDIEDAAQLFAVFDFQVMQREKSGFQMLKDSSGFELMLFNPAVNQDGISHWNNLKTAERGVGVEIVIVVNEVEQKYAAIKNLGYDCSEVQDMSWGTKEFTFKIKDGYMLRIKQYNHDR